MKSSFKIFFIIYFLLFISLFIISFSFSYSKTPIKIPNSLETTISKVFTQGWGFFSKNPKDEKFYAIDLKTGDYVGEWPNMTLGNFYGFKKKGRSQGIELGRLYEKANPANMKKCKNSPKQCLTKMKPINVENDIKEPTILGDVGIIKEEPTPWAWANDYKGSMPSKVMRLKVYEKN
ncbi:SdpA family antimicrobial peptide system protein [Staphylococcus sp. 17KM0847]|uniref:SdpA family antimicrobial peptide system protein n=1 Tax=Staphylococcus sp. 17KM0847 TaxID=2583989 RepID=UPI0015DDF197|nr:SdpA family antimicrobial peptide system protein [Staphylococcus sp. 17KM0847]